MTSENTTFEVFIPRVVNEQPCSRHKALIGYPCYDIHTIGGDVLSGVCNKRARAAGMTGKITKDSLAKQR